MPFLNLAYLEYSKVVQYIIFYDCWRYLLPLEVCGAMKATEEKEDRVSDFIKP